MDGFVGNVKPKHQLLGNKSLISEASSAAAAVSAIYCLRIEMLLKHHKDGVIMYGLLLLLPVMTMLGKPEVINQS